MDKRDKNELIAPLLRSIDEMLRRDERVVVAVDGNSAAGKSSLAARLKSLYSCNVFSMDDFFLRPSQRTPGRLAEPGGNIDYERFLCEIIEPLKLGEPFAFSPFDCSVGELSAPVQAEPNRLSVIEGVYSLHPYFGRFCDLKVFLSLGEAEQRRRLLARNAGLYERFICEWIPMENLYFNHFKIAEKCDFVFDSGFPGVLPNSTDGERPVEGEKNEQQ